jgi:hypothetical protein
MYETPPERVTGESGSLAFQPGVLGVVADDRPRQTIAPYSFYKKHGWSDW